MPEIKPGVRPGPFPLDKSTPHRFDAQLLHSIPVDACKWCDYVEEADHHRLRNRLHVFSHIARRCACAEPECQCKCGELLSYQMHVPALDVPRTEELAFGFPKQCATCSAMIHRSADHLVLNYIHGDRAGEGPIHLCGIGCAAIFVNHRNDMEAIERAKTTAYA